MEVSTTGRARRFWPRLLRRRGRRRERTYIMVLVPGLVGVGLALLLIQAVEAGVQPLIKTLAETAVRNAVTAAIDGAVENALAEGDISYDEIIHIKTDSSGYVTAMTADTLRLNRLRTDILGRVMDRVESLDSRELEIPLGNLTGFSWLSGWGPGLQV